MTDFTPTPERPMACCWSKIGSPCGHRVPPRYRGVHTWLATGPGGLSVHHNAGLGSGTDSIGVGLGEDILGPFGSNKLARKVADALNNAYTLGVTSGELRERARIENNDNGGTK